MDLDLAVRYPAAGKIKLKTDEAAGPTLRCNRAETAGGPGVPAGGADQKAREIFPFTRTVFTLKLPPAAFPLGGAQPHSFEELRAFANRSFRQQIIEGAPADAEAEDSCERDQRLGRGGRDAERAYLLVVRREQRVADAGAVEEVPARRI